MVFMIGQIMSGTQKLSQNNTPETFNRILEAIYDPSKSDEVLLDLAVSSHGIEKLAVHGTMDINEKGFAKIVEL